MTRQHFGAVLMVDDRTPVRSGPRGPRQIRQGEENLRFLCYHKFNCRIFNTRIVSLPQVRSRVNIRAVNSVSNKVICDVYGNTGHGAGRVGVSGAATTATVCDRTRLHWQ